MPIRVMIVDDSNFMRKAVSKLISSEPGFEVVGLISNGEEALRSIPVLKPDVVTLDVEMEGMDGLTTLRRIMETNPTPVIMFSAYTKRGADITLKSLQEGAVDFIEKPSGSLSIDLGAVRDELIKKIKVASTVRHRRAIVPSSSGRIQGRELRLPNPERSVIAIGSSTGGVQALQAVIPKLPKSLPLPVLIVQHMPPMFTKSLAESLDSHSMIRVKEASVGDILAPGNAYIAPGGLHMTVRRGSGGAYIHLDKNPEGELLRPSVDVMFRSVAEVYGADTVGVILTGMGNDGTAGLKVLKTKGAKVIAQDEATCVVFGMPRMAVEAGVVDIVLPVHEIAYQIEKMVM
ncbi:MAG: chemotaxis response regulator protein-glutamate methylesterase [Deltaproteobacteria bacterium]